MFDTAMIAAVVPDVYRQFAESNRWALLFPEILVAALSLATLADGLLLRRRTAAWYTPAMVKGFLLLLSGFCAWNAVTGRSIDFTVAFGGLVVQHGWFTDAARAFFLLTAFAVTSISEHYLKRRNLGRHEFHHLVLVATAAMMLLVQANHFVLFFLALETVAVTLYVLVGYDRRNAFPLEAGVKYVISGGLSSALLLAGIVLLAGFAGNHAGAGDMFRFDKLQFAIAMLVRDNGGHLPPVMLAGIALTLAGVAFKLGAFPFNVWIPDVYQGAPSPVTAFLGAGSKGAGVFALLVLVASPTAPFGVIPEIILTMLVPVAALTLLFGNIAALGQNNVKRLMGLSGISHAGFLLVAVCAALATRGGTREFTILVIVAYLAVYLLATTLVFAVIGRVAGDDETGHHIHDYRRLYARNPVLAGLLATGIGSLAGIPPTLGFVTKLLVLILAFNAGLYWLFGIALACVVAGVYYYFAWLREAFHRSKEDTPAEPLALDGSARILLTVIAAILAFGWLAQLFCCR